MKHIAEIAFAVINTSVAAWRLYSLIGHEDGPKLLLRRFRVRLLGVEYASSDPNDGENWNRVVNARRGSLVAGLCCPWCCGLWFAVALWVLYLAFGWSVQMAIAPLTISAVAIKVDKVVNGYGSRYDH
jgi:hypothetical protein